MAKYKRCPRCELNWIPEEEEYCDVCKAELKIGGASLLEDEEEELCPVCHVNYLEPGEKICSYCAQKNPDNTDDDEHVYNIDDTDRSEEDLEKVSFDELAEEESWADYDEPFDDNENFDDADYSDEDDEEEEEEEEEEFHDDIEDDFDYDIDSVEDIDEEDEEKEDLNNEDD